MTSEVGGSGEQPRVDSVESERSTAGQDTVSLNELDEATNSLFQEKVQDLVGELSTSAQALNKAVPKSTEFRLHSTKQGEQLEGLARQAKADVQTLKGQWEAKKANHKRHLEKRIDGARKDLRKNQEGRSKNIRKNIAYEKADFRFRMLVKHGYTDDTQQTPKTAAQMRAGLSEDKTTLESQLKNETDKVQKRKLKDAISILNKEIKQLDKTDALKASQAFEDMEAVSDAADQCAKRIMHGANQTVKSQRARIQNSEYQIRNLTVSKSSSKASQRGMELANLVATISKSADGSMSAIRSSIRQGRERQVKELLSDGAPRSETRYRAKISDLVSRKNNLDKQISAWHEKAEKLKAKKPKSGFIAKVRYERRWRKHEKKGQKLSGEVRALKSDMRGLERARKADDRSIRAERTAPTLVRREQPEPPARPAPTPNQPSGDELRARFQVIEQQAAKLETKLDEINASISQWRADHEDKFNQYLQLAANDPNAASDDEDIQNFNALIFTRSHHAAKLERLRREQAEIQELVAN